MRRLERADVAASQAGSTRRIGLVGSSRFVRTGQINAGGAGHGDRDAVHEVATSNSVAHRRILAMRRGIRNTIIDQSALVTAEGGCYAPQQGDCSMNEAVRGISRCTASRGILAPRLRRADRRIALVPAWAAPRPRSRLPEHSRRRHHHVEAIDQLADIMVEAPRAALRFADPARSNRAHLGACHDQRPRAVSPGARHRRELTAPSPRWWPWRSAFRPINRRR